jgi:Uma2 family endonuclease
MGRNTIRLSMAPPILVVEVVSPGDLQRDRDYVAKRIQYLDRGIPEYWVVDPETQTILVLLLQADQYRDMGCFRGEDAIVSPSFPTLRLTAHQVFTSGRQ